ncbi:MAG: hypothetical protein IPJ86_14560 [Bacteroidetes bacterium]|nr:hypothetical protein [Bacteroidota bacterium]
MEKTIMTIEALAKKVREMRYKAEMEMILPLDHEEVEPGKDQGLVLSNYFQ